MLVVGCRGQRAYTIPEREALLRTALTAQAAPWVTRFRLATVSEDILEWLPATLLVSALPGTDSVALEYQAAPVSTSPRVAPYSDGRRWRDYQRHVRPGTWLSYGEEGSARFPRVAYAETESEYFPGCAAVPVLSAARTLRYFFATGLRSNAVTWRHDPHRAWSPEPRPAP